MNNYPLNFTFKLLALNPQIRINDAAGNTVLFVKQKAFALKEDVKIYKDEKMNCQQYQINADKIIDFSAGYTIKDSSGATICQMKRRGAKSIWRTTYEIYNAGNIIGAITEENPLIKIIDSMVSNIPFLSMLINPAYLVAINGRTALCVKKKPAFFEGKFSAELRDKITAEEERIILPCSIMMILLERMKG